MTTCQRPLKRIFVRISSRQRTIAIVVFLAIGGMFVYLWAVKCGWLDSTSLLGVCGFQQRTGLPCLGCYWTRAGQAFVAGHILLSFYIQPAAAVFYSAAVVIAFFALLSGVFGVQFAFLKRFYSKKVFWIVTAAGGVLILAAWLLEVVRTILEVEVV